jgi:hypothetical protein
MREEQLNAALKPFNKDSNMLKMFNFSKMEDTSLKRYLQNVSSHPLRADQATKNPQAADEKLNCYRY